MNFIIFRLPRVPEGNVSPTKPPCSSCFMIKNEIILDKHKAESHRVEPPFICKECFHVSNTWLDYVAHMKLHLRFAAKCNECVYSALNTPEIVMFLCHVCEKSFDSDELLKAHVHTHKESGQNNDGDVNS